MRCKKYSVAVVNLASGKAVKTKNVVTIEKAELVANNFTLALDSPLHSIEIKKGWLCND